MNYALIASIIIIAGFIGWAVAYFGGLDTAAQSTYTAYGAAAGAAVAGALHLVYRKKSLNDKAGR